MKFKGDNLWDEIKTESLQASNSKDCSNKQFLLGTEKEFGVWVLGEDATEETFMPLSV